MAKSQDVVVGLDIGTSKVSLVAGMVQEGLIQVVGVGMAPNTGMRKGAIVDIEDTVSAISAAVESAERTSGLPIQNAYIGLAGSQVAVHEAKGVVAVSRADAEIGESDIGRVLDAARVVAVPANREVLHTIPMSYAVDGQHGVKDPVGMRGVRLEVDAQVVSVATSALRNELKCIEQAELTPIEIIYTPLATAKTILTKKQKESGVILIDIGAGTTSLIIFEEGEMVYSSILPVGSMHLTNDIAIGLRISLDAAEKLKIKHGAASKAKLKEGETISISAFEPEEKDKIERKFLVEIIEARLNELFTMIREELKKIGKDGMLPAGAVITGGGSQLEGITEIAKEHLRLPASVGTPMVEVAGLIDQLDDPSFTAALGLMMWGIEAENAVGRTSTNSSDIHKVGNDLLKRAKHIFGQFLP